MTKSPASVPLAEPGPDYKSPALAVAAGSTVRVWDASLASEDAVSSSSVMARAAVSPTAISWNRNNKVAAIGLEDGRVQIRYANGTCMSTLLDDHRDDHRDDRGASPVTSLSWSTGSKTLAVGSLGGRVSVHDMTTKQHTSKVIRHDPTDSGSSGKLTAVGLRHHPDDAFLAVGGKDSVELYSLRLEEAKGSCACSASSVVKNDASFSSVSVVTGKPYVAAGSDKNGIVAVWDYVTEVELACDKFRHAHKGSTKVELAPLSPSLLYSVGMDGILKLQDLRLPSSIASPTAMASVPSAAGISSMSVHEFSGDIAVGTNDGYVYIFAGGLVSRRPKHSLFFGDDVRDEECPVLAVDWTRSYHNVTLHAKQAVLDSERVKTPLSRGYHERRQARPAGPAGNVGEQSTAAETETEIEIETEDVPRLPAAATIRRTPAMRQPSPSKSASPAADGDATPLVRRVSAADPWKIRAANVVDGSSTTPSSISGGPVAARRHESPDMAVAAKKAVIQTQRATETAAHENVGTDSAVATDAAGENLSQLILALHLDMVQMHDAQSTEIRALREEVIKLKDELSSIKQSAKLSGEFFGI